MVTVEARTQPPKWLGPVLMSAGLLAAVLGGFTLSDCFMCTSAELISAVGGQLLFFGGVVSWTLRALGSTFMRACAVIVLTLLFLPAAIAARLLVTSLVMGGI